MKVVYASITRQLDEAIAAAARDGRTNGHIELTVAEALQLGTELEKGTTFFPATNKYPETYYGVPLKVVLRARTPESNPRHTRS